MSTAVLLPLLLSSLLLPLGDAQKYPDLETLQPRIEKLEETFKDAKSDEADAGEAALELMKIASKLNEGPDTSESIRLARSIFLSSAPAKARRQAFAILSQWAPQELSKHVTYVRINGPHTTCWGRFQDALDARLLGANDWILKARAHNTHLHRGGNALGTIARLEFAIDKPRKPKELISALKEAYFDTRSWTIFVETPIEEYFKEVADE